MKVLTPLSPYYFLPLSSLLHHSTFWFLFYIILCDHIYTLFCIYKLPLLGASYNNNFFASIIASFLPKTWWCSFLGSGRRELSPIWLIWKHFFLDLKHFFCWSVWRETFLIPDNSWFRDHSLKILRDPNVGEKKNWLFSQPAKILLAFLFYLSRHSAP